MTAREHLRAGDGALQADTRARTSIAPAAAKMALTCVPAAEDAGGTPMGRVCVEENAVIATDGKRLLVVEEPHVEGLFPGERVVALVPPAALKDAIRGKLSRISVRADELVAYDEEDENRVIRQVPFEELPPVPGPTPDAMPVPAQFPDWRAVRPGRRRVAVRLNPALLADVFKRLAAENVVGVDVCVGRSDEVVSFHAELPGERQVTFLVMPLTARAPALPGVPQLEAQAARPDDESKGTEEAEDEASAPPRRGRKGKA